MIARSTVFCLLLGCAALAAATPPMQFSMCTAQTPSLPLSSTTPAQPGRSQMLLAMVEKRLGATISHHTAPRRRCQLLVERGQYDAMNFTGHAGINRTIAVFPMRDGQVDPSRSLGAVPSLLYRRIGDKADFQAGKIVHTDKPVAVLAARQVTMAAVARAGGTSEDGAKTVLALAQKLIAGQVDLAASAEPDFADLVATQFKGRLEVLPTPLVESHYYVVFSRGYFARHAAAVERFWNQIAATRADPAYLRRISQISQISQIGQIR